MAIIQSAATGDAHVGASWVGGVAPGTTDFGEINTGHVVTVAVGNPTAVMGYIIDGGTLVQNADITITDTSGAGMRVHDTNSGGFSSNGTAAAPRLIKSASADPTYPWDWDVDQVDGKDERSLNFAFVEMRGSKYYIGNSHYYACPNDKADWDKVLVTKVVPPMPEHAIVEHQVRGRNAGRVYPGPFSARTMTIAGSCRRDSYFWQTVSDIMTSRQRIAFFSDIFHLPKCWIEGRPSFTPRGGKYVDFTITLREDV